VQAVLGLAAVTGGLAYGVPKLTGAAWGAVTDELEQLSLVQVLMLLALWLLGLYAQTFLATAAMPDLTHRRALALNLSGSAVSNLFPLGGALGMGLTYAMIRSWGHERRAFASYTALTTFGAVFMKLAMPIVALALLVVAGDLPSAGIARLAVGAAGALLVLLAVVAVVLISDRVALLTGRGLQRVVVRLLRLVRSQREVACASALSDLRLRVVLLVRRNWRRMALGMTSYAVLQAALLWAILAMLGSDLGVVSVFAGFAFGRLLSLLVLTPGGVGVAELGSAALLVTLGGEPAVVAAGTLLYTGITFALEIPIGGVCGLVWWRTSGRGVRAA
jgi:uncharacterized membrane protein YbhN (UPF0104 family)